MKKYVMSEQSHAVADAVRCADLLEKEFQNDNGSADRILEILSELTEFEEELRQVIVSALSGETPNGSGGTMSWAVDLSDDDVRKLAPKVLELAKKKLLKQWNEDMKNEYERGKRDGLTIGYNKATKEYNESVAYHYDNPPYVFCRFGGICNNPMKDCLNCPMNPVGLNTTTTISGTCKKD